VNSWNSTAQLEYVGCYADDPGDRDLSYRPWGATGAFTPLCAASCTGFQYFGLLIELI
jgi:hypothetical protein